MNESNIKSMISMPLGELCSIADCRRRKETGGRLEICSIVNAKSGRCSEDCKFCAQSVHYKTDISEYPLKSKDEIRKAALEAERNGADRFGIVTSGQRLGRKEVSLIADAVRDITKDSNILLCASLGALDEESFGILKEAGLSRYHHNLETSGHFYAQIVTTHKYEERVNIIRRAKKAGLEICSGGIFGMGETWQDRIDMAFLLNKLEVDSVPLNFLVPIKGTPMENLKGISGDDAIRTIALFRILLKNKTLKVIAGRESVLKNRQEMMYAAGANGMMIGGYLTTQGRSLEEDQLLIRQIKLLWSKE